MLSGEWDAGAQSCPRLDPDRLQVHDERSDASVDDRLVVAFGRPECVTPDRHLRRAVSRNGFAAVDDRDDLGAWKDSAGTGADGRQVGGGRQSVPATGPPPFPFAP